MNIYRLALQVQDASNPNGVINSLANEVMPAIRDEPQYRAQGTSYITTHPALILFLDKLNSMTRLQSIGDMESSEVIYAAYSACRERAEGLEAVEAAKRTDGPLADHIDACMSLCTLGADCDVEHLACSFCGADPQQEDIYPTRAQS
jgi:hypothetical protein